MTTRRSEFLRGVKGVLPLLVGAAPFGLIYGVSARSAGIAAPAVQAMSFIVFAGSAQFVIVQLIAAGVPAGIIILTAVIVNLRHALYSASVAPYLKRLHVRWRMLLAYLMTDEAYAVAITHYQERGDTARRHWYFLGAGLTLWSTWQVSTAVGILLGTQVPSSWSLDFALPLTFIALVVPLLKERAGLAAALTAGIAAVVAVNLPFKLGLVVATLIGITIGVLLEPRSKKAAKVSEEEQEVGQRFPLTASAEAPSAHYLGKDEA